MQMQKFLTSAKASFFQVLLFGTFRKLGYLISRVLVIRTLLLKGTYYIRVPYFRKPLFSDYRVNKMCWARGFRQSFGLLDFLRSVFERFLFRNPKP